MQILQFKHRVSPPVSGERARIKPLKVALLLAAGVGILTVFSFAANVLALRDFPHAQKLQAIFSVDEEDSIATWWSALTLAGLGLLTWCIGSLRIGDQPTQRLAWRLLALGFVFLSMDEACRLHERIGGLVSIGGTFEHARWILLWLPLAAIPASVIFWKLWRASPQVVVGLILGAGVFLSGAVGVETFNGVYRMKSEVAATHLADSGVDTGKPHDRTGKQNMRYVAGTAVEECLEMFGVVVWYGVLFGAYRKAQSAEAAVRNEPPSLDPIHTIRPSTDPAMTDLRRASV